jgi:hypothetical protein
MSFRLYSLTFMHDSYSTELKRIEENSTYSAEAHHAIALRNNTIQQRFQLAPAVTAALLGTLVAGQVVPGWVAWLTALSAIATAIATVIDPIRSYYEHLSAAKAFTAMKHDARALRETFSATMDEMTLASAVKNIHDRYNDLTRLVPPTDDKALKEAQRRIQREKVHEPD